MIVRFCSLDFSSPYSRVETPIKMFTSIVIKIRPRENIDILSPSPATPWTTDFTGQFIKGGEMNGQILTVDWSHILNCSIPVSLALCWTISTSPWLEAWKSDNNNLYPETDSMLRVKAGQARVPRTGPVKLWPSKSTSPRYNYRNNNHKNGNKIHSPDTRQEKTVGNFESKDKRFGGWQVVSVSSGV